MLKYISIPWEHHLLDILWMLVHSLVSDSLWPDGLYPARFIWSWNFPGKNIRAGCHFLLQGNLPNPGSEPTSLLSPALAVGFLTLISTYSSINIDTTLQVQHTLKVIFKICLRCFCSEVPYCYFLKKKRERQKLHNKWYL